MKITSIRIRTLSNTGNKMVGLVSLTLGDMVALHDIKILKNQNELFLAMPSRPTKNGTFKDVVHPINAQVRETIERIAFSAHKYCLEESIGSAQFDLKTDFSGVLTDQVFENFILSSSSDNTNVTYNEQGKDATTRVRKSVSSNPIGEDLSKWLEG